MDKQVLSLDLDSNLGTVTLTDGSELAVPKLSMSKLIKLVKFIGIDGAKLYQSGSKVLLNSDLDEMEKLIEILEMLTEEQLIRVFSILLDMEDKQALALDFNEMLDVLLIYSDKVDFDRTFLQIRTLAKKVLKKDLPPTFGEWIQTLKPKKKAQESEPARAGVVS